MLLTEVERQTGQKNVLSNEEFTYDRADINIDIDSDPTDKDFGPTKIYIERASEQSVATPSSLCENRSFSCLSLSHTKLTHTACDSPCAIKS